VCSPIFIFRSHCGKYDTVNYVMTDQREKYQRRWE
jgi:hypothetical protein